MTISAPSLPFAKDALAPHISEETLNFHFDKHHMGYYNKLVAAVEGTDMEGKSLEELVKTTEGGVFNNAAQIWNHSFYWNCLSGEAKAAPEGALASAIDSAFGSFEAFKEKFSAQAMANFGSGWTWLVKKADGSVAIVDTSNAATPLTDNSITPLLTVDVWEHAYYVDYRNARNTYLENIWNVINWSFVESNYG